MHFGGIFVSLALATGAFAGSLTELKIDRVYVPEKCDIKSRNGDMMAMHYVSTDCNASIICDGLLNL
jgi:hypothetical protein